MLTDKEYIKLSIETNLFFLRISKEHMIFAAASLSPRDRSVAAKLLKMKDSIEELLSEAVEMADRLISQEVLASDELVTDYTLAAEMKTQFLTGIPIDIDITRRELEIRAEKQGMRMDGLLMEIAGLNRNAMLLTKAAIDILKAMRNNVKQCKAFSYTYPSMQEHVIEESEYYYSLLEKLEKRDIIDSLREMAKVEANWNHLMKEHSEFIRGYLDPKEKKLIKKADSFAEEFEKLVEKAEAAAADPGKLPEVTRESRKSVTEIRNFKTEGTVGILKCEIESLIPPLLADHVTREANHFLRLLKSFRNAE